MSTPNASKPSPVPILVAAAGVAAGMVGLVRPNTGHGMLAIGMALFAGLLGSVASGMGMLEVKSGDAKRGAAIILVALMSLALAVMILTRA